MKYARDEFEHEGIVYRAYTDGQIGYYRVTPVAKPMLRIGAYRHAMGDGFAEFPMRLERNRTGQYYWSMARGGEYHLWLTVKCNGGSKTATNAVPEPGTQMDAIRTAT